MKHLVLVLALLTAFLALVGSASAVGMTVGNFRYSDAVNPDDRYYAVDVVITDKDVPLFSVEKGLVEIDLINANRPYSIFVGDIETCESTFGYNVHRDYAVVGTTLVGTEYEKFTLTARNIPDGTYKAVLVHYTGCAKNGGKMKQPLGYVVLRDRVVFGAAAGNVLDQCDNEYEAAQYLKAKGVLNCRVAACVDAPSSSSKAVCSVSGECNVGAVQSQTCKDGSTVDVRICTNNNWVSTGITCPNQPPPPVPPPDALPKMPVNLMGWGLIGVAGVAGFFVLRRFGVVRF